MAAEAKKISVGILAPGQMVQLISTPEIKTKIRDARVDVFIDVGDTNKVMHVVEYGLEHSNSKVYSEKAFKVITNETPVSDSPAIKDKP